MPNPGTTIQGIYSLLDEELQQVRDIISKAVKPKRVEIAELVKIIDLTGGKFLRPVVLLLTAGMLGNFSKDHLTASAIIELIHNATLLHDDVIDQGSQRRHRWTVNALHGNESAVLLGDLLLTRVFRLTSSLASNIQNEISASTSSLCEGELRQVLTKPEDIFEETYFDIIENKTASLFGCTCRVAAMISQEDQPTITRVSDIGFKLGSAFQITDDILDLTQADENAGKTTHRDLPAGKLTLPFIHHLNCRQVTQENAASYLENRSRKELLEMVQKTASIEYAANKAQTMLNTAAEHLTTFGDSDYRSAFYSLLDYISYRVK